MNTYIYNSILSKKNQANDKYFMIIENEIFNAFNNIYPFSIVNVNNTEFIMRYDSKEGDGRILSINVHAIMNYNQINDNYIVDIKVNSLVKDNNGFEVKFQPSTKTKDAILIGFEIEELISTIDKDELNEIINIFFMNNLINYERYYYW